MSSVDVNDENRGVYPGGKHSSSNDDIFALDEPTGRPSILRQTENLPNKTVPKGIKVCFQTPRRDPVTKKILSPNKSVKMTSVDECTKLMEILLTFSTKASSYPDDIMPIKSKGGYQLDFDNLDAINPFGGSNKMVLSPARPVVENPTTDQKCFVLYSKMQSYEKLTYLFSLVMANDFDDQIDYLEQFGSSSVRSYFMNN
uniref:Uncharacterized protein n=1 Tax=Mastacembelus armatus TaxID=205130 RepID=A0A7N8XGT4_9TELE